MHQAWLRVYSRMLKVIVPVAVALELRGEKLSQQHRFADLLEKNPSSPDRLCTSSSSSNNVSLSSTTNSFSMSSYDKKSDRINSLNHAHIHSSTSSEANIEFENSINVEKEEEEEEDSEAIAKKKEDEETEKAYNSLFADIEKGGCTFQFLSATNEQAVDPAEENKAEAEGMKNARQGSYGLLPDVIRNIENKSASISPMSCPFSSFKKPAEDSTSFDINNNKESQLSSEVDDLHGSSCPYHNLKEENILLPSSTTNPFSSTTTTTASPSKSSMIPASCPHASKANEKTPNKQSLNSTTNSPSKIIKN